jgi:predicted nucleic acid-binding protein
MSKEQLMKLYMKFQDTQRIVEYQEKTIQIVRDIATDYIEA